MKKFWIHNLSITLSLLVVFLVTLYSIGIYDNRFGHYLALAIHSQFDHRPLQYQAPNRQYDFTGNFIRSIFLSNNHLHVQLFIHIVLRTTYTRINEL